METKKTTTEEIEDLTLAAIVEAETALNYSKKMIEDQQKTINEHRNIIKTLIHINNGKVTFSLGDFSQATAQGIDVESKINEIDHTTTLTLIKRSVQ